MSERKEFIAKTNTRQLLTIDTGGLTILPTSLRTYRHLLTIRDNSAMKTKLINLSNFSANFTDSTLTD